MLFLLLTLGLTYLPILKPCHDAHTSLEIEVLSSLGRTGSLSEGQNKWTTGGPLRNVNIQSDYTPSVGRVLAKFQEARTVAYTDDGYIKAKLSVTLGSG
jgi:hypothetical protein